MWVQWGAVTTCTASNASYSYSIKDDEEQKKRRNAYWAEMRRCRLPWWRKFRPSKTVAKSAPREPDAKIIRISSESRKAIGGRYGNKAVLRKLAA